MKVRANFSIAAALLAAASNATAAVAFVPTRTLSPRSCRTRSRIAHTHDVSSRQSVRLAVTCTESALFREKKQDEKTSQISSAGVNGIRRKKRRGPISTFRRKLRIQIKRGRNVKMLRQNAFALTAGLCLSFNSGYINGCCLSGILKPCGSGVAVAAFTGAYTNAGLALGAGNLAKFASNIRMILCFITGSCLSGLINPRPTPNRMSPRYGPTFLLGSILMTISSILANTRPEGKSFLYFAAMANGLQNAVSSMYSANLIRSTHMSGITSDIGMIFGQMLRGNMDNAWRFTVLISLATSFLLGGCTSFFAVTKFKSLALVFNAVLFFAIAVNIIGFTSYQQRVSLWRAASGRWEWKSNKAPSEEYLAELFERHDSDGSGYLDVDKFQTVLTEAGMENMTDVGIRAIFKQVDSNEDGRITQNDLIGLVMCSAEDEEECQLVFPKAESSFE